MISEERNLILPFYDFLSLKNDVNVPVPSKSNKQKKFEKIRIH